MHLIANPHPRYASMAQSLREEFGGTVIANGGFARERAEAALQNGEAHLSSFGRPFIANPDLVRRFELGAALAEPQAATFYTPGASGYVDYASLTT